MSLPVVLYRCNSEDLRTERPYRRLLRSWESGKCGFLCRLEFPSGTSSRNSRRPGRPQTERIVLSSSCPNRSIGTAVTRSCIRPIDM